MPNIQRFKMKPQEATEILDYVQFNGINHESIMNWAESFGLKTLNLYDKQGKNFLFIQSGTWDEEEFTIIPLNSWVHCYQRDNDDDATSYVHSDEYIKEHFEKVGQ